MSLTLVFGIAVGVVVGVVSHSVLAALVGLFLSGLAAVFIGLLLMMWGMVRSRHRQGP